jgi:hypothetical protein
MSTYIYQFLLKDYVHVFEICIMCAGMQALELLLCSNWTGVALQLGIS